MELGPIVDRASLELIVHKDEHDTFLWFKKQCSGCGFWWIRHPIADVMGCFEGVVTSTLRLTTGAAFVVVPPPPPRFSLLAKQISALQCYKLECRLRMCLKRRVALVKSVSRPTGVCSEVKLTRVSRGEGVEKMVVYSGLDSKYLCHKHRCLPGKK